MSPKNVFTRYGFSSLYIFSLCLSLSFSVHVCFLRWSCYWLWRAHSNTTNFSTSDILGSAGYMEVRWFSCTGMRAAKLPWLSGDHRVVAPSPIACDAPPSAGDPFLSFCPTSHLCYSGSQKGRLCVIVSFQWESFLLNFILCMCVDVHVLSLHWPHSQPISMIALSPSVHLLIQ